MSNLTGAGADLISEALFDIKTYDLDAITDAARHMAGTAAESYCTYTPDCMAIISRHDSETADADIEEHTGGKTYTAAQWSDAMADYARAIAHCVIDAQLGEALKRLDAAAEQITDAINARADVPQEIETTDLRISTDCPAGYFAHDHETPEGLLVWQSRQCDGDNAIAIKTDSVWLSYGWTPGPRKTPC